MEKVISYFAHENIMSHMERTNKRLWIICIVLIISLIGTNVGWLYYESQFDNIATTVTQEVDSSGGNAIINDGVHFNGESEADSNN